MFSKEDILQMETKGIKPENVEYQISTFKNGFPFIQLTAPATPGNGILTYSDEEAQQLAHYFDTNKNDYQVMKFVPASGAASRMFKHLLSFRKQYKGTQEEISQLEQDKDFNSTGYFFRNLEKFAFYEELKQVLSQHNLVLEELLKKNDYNTLLDFFLNEKGMNYAKLPKALLHFHQYPEGARKAFEEHLVEAAHYATDENKKAHLHFTVSGEHQSAFEDNIARVRKYYEDKFGIRYDIGFSQQKPGTDTLAVDMENEPFRNTDGSLVFRPGGHGALIENLNDLDAEIIFIKNIDNIVPDRLRDTTYLYKKVLGGLLLQLQEKTFDYLDLLDDGEVNDLELSEIRKFAQNELKIYFPPVYETYNKWEKIDFLFNKLNRPMRLAGMVKNEGEPGGGPFWIVNEKDEHSLQIVESSQMDLTDETQKSIVAKATHFNPVDLVCAVYNFKGAKFDLTEFVDPETGFIAQKSQDGRDLKAMELPGLWNGAMADWITLFVEVPLITFNPVKTINDLLRSQHQPQ
ncbi:MAG: DUF4301 family protein [Bacteroidales bacterium]|nr:DUF4301 family protein [Bacteroidales bacterium]